MATGKSHRARRQTAAAYHRKCVGLCIHVVPCTSPPAASRCRSTTASGCRSCTGTVPPAHPVGARNPSDHAPKPRWRRYPTQPTTRLVYVHLENVHVKLHRCSHRGARAPPQGGEQNFCGLNLQEKVVSAPPRQSKRSGRWE